MRSELEKSAQIDRYLNQQMAGEELADFQQRLNDPAFQHEVETHRVVYALVIDRGLIDLKKKLQALDGNEPGHTNRFTKWGISILLLLVIGALTTYQFSNPEVRVPQSTPEQRSTSVPKKTEVTSSAGSTIAASDNKKHTARTETSVQHDTTNTDRPATMIRSEPEKETMKHQELQSIPPVSFPAAPNASHANATSEPEAKDEKKVSDCIIAMSELKIITLPSCTNSPTGQIVIDDQSTLIGTAPFQFSVGNEKYSGSRLFTHLYAGNYYLTIKDAAGCEWQYPTEIRIDENDCVPAEFAFYPDRDEVWRLPVTPSTNGKIDIYNRNGSRVYSADIVHGYPDQWDGTSSDGQVLPMGSYSFILHVAGEAVNGHVTILK